MVALPSVDGGSGVELRQECPRCGAAFACGATKLDQPCACSAPALTANRLASIRESWTGCLCVTCLTELAGDEGDGPARPAAVWRGR